MRPEIELDETGLQELRRPAQDEGACPAEDTGAMLRRVAQAVAQPEARYESFADLGRVADGFYELMSSGRFLPAPPMLDNAGRPDGQLSACFVLPVEDSMEGIFNAAKNAARIHTLGGGAGFSLSRLRPEGAAVRSTGGVASGPASFLSVFNVAAGSVQSGRRGSNLGVLRVDHPDILAFIRCPSADFRLCVGVTQAFLDAVEAGGDYGLVDPHTRQDAGRLSAKEVFGAIAHAARRGELGVVFLDRIRQDNVVPLQGEVEAVDPCGQPLLPYESCALGSVNLARMARAGKVDYALLRETVHEAVHFLDNAIDANRYPLEEISRTTRATRRIGLGVMGFADLLDQLGIEYSGEKAVQLAEALMGFVNTEAHAASTALASRRGSFPLFAESIYQHGAPMRNACVTAVAPSDALACLAGCARGIEPLPGREGDVPAEAHIRMQAAFQKHTDSAVAKEIWLPGETSDADVEQLCLLAAETGCKGVMFRSAAQEAPQAQPPEAAQEAPQAQPPEAVQEAPARRTQPDVAAGFTERVRTGCGELYVTVNYDADGPCGVFVSAPPDGCPGQSEAVARLASLALRAGVPVGEICAQLRGICCPDTVRRPGANCESCPDAVARVLAKAGRLARSGGPGRAPAPEPEIAPDAPAGED